MSPVFRSPVRKRHDVSSVPDAPPEPPRSQFLKLEGMLTADMVDDDVEYAEVLEDIKGECESSGHTVEAILMPRAGPLKCNCYVKFATIDGAAAARTSLDQRQFDGNVVKATFIPESEMPPAS